MREKTTQLPKNISHFISNTKFNTQIKFTQPFNENIKLEYIILVKINKYHHLEKYTTYSKLPFIWELEPQITVLVNYNKMNNESYIKVTIVTQHE